MSILQKDHLDLLQGGDTGQDNVDAIQPVEDGEGATQTVFRRPSENLRGRTEVIRDIVNDLLYYRDASHLVIEGGPGHSIGWAGSTTAAGTGIITQTGDLTLRPLLTPATSTKGSLSIGSSGINAVIYTVDGAAYATQGLNAVTVEHRDAGVGATHQCTITDGPVKRILVEFDGTDITHTSAATKVLVDAAVAVDTDLAGLIVVTDDGIAGNTIAADSETPLEGTADQEAHTLVSGALTTFTTANPLAEGDAIGIWYRYVVEPGGASGDSSDPKGGVFGGRQESNPDRGTDTIPQASLFVTSSDPEKIPGAVPVCKVVNNELVFVDGSRFVEGMTGALGTATGLSIGASAFQGTRTLTINGGLPSSPDPNTAQALFEATDTRLGQLRVATYTCTDGVTSTGGDFTGVTAVSDAVTAAGGTGAVIYVRRGTYTLPNTYSLLANTTIIGEDRDNVILSQAAPVSLTLGANVHLHSLSFGSDVIFIGGADERGSIENCTVLDGSFLSSAGPYWAFKDLLFENSAATGSVLEIAGTGSIAENIVAQGGVELRGQYVCVTGLHITPSAAYEETLLTIASSGVQLSGLSISPLTAALADTAAPVVVVTGDRHRITNGVVNQVGAPLAVTNSILELRGGTHGVFTQLTIDTTEGHALTINNTSGPNLNTGFQQCSFANNLTAGVEADYLVGVATGAEDDHHVTWNNCTFDQNEKGDASMFALNSGPISVPRWFFSNCVLNAAVTDDLLAATFTDSVFNDCLFKIKNPETAGVRRLPGSKTTQLWRFIQSTSGLGCSLTDCTFDMLDSEVELDPTDPYTGAIPGYFIHLQGSVAKNLKIINVNKHISTGPISSSGSLVNLSHVSKLEDFEIVFTSTVSVSGGTANISAIITMDDNSILDNWRHLEHPHNNNYIRIIGDTTIRINNCRLYGLCAEYVHLSGVCDWLEVSNCRFGTSTVAQFSPITIYPSASVSYTNNIWYAAAANHLIEVIATAPKLLISLVNNYFHNSTAVNDSIAAIGVNGAVVSHIKLVGNTIVTASTGAGTRELFSGGGGGVGAVLAAANAYLNHGGTTASTTIVPVTNAGW